MRSQRRGGYRNNPRPEVAFKYTIRTSIELSTVLLDPSSCHNDRAEAIVYSDVVVYVETRRILERDEPFYF